MRLIKKLNVDPADIFDTCVSELKDRALAERFKNVRTEITANFQEYERRAGSHQLFSFNPSTWGDDNQLVFAGMTKKEFVDLYSNQMVGEKKSREYYDRLMMLAPLGKCPFCGFGQASTLDHFLSKARYPAFSILCANLIPACADCNKGKGAAVLTQDNQMLHPYFEDAIVETNPWLFAEVVQSVPATVRYFIRPPNSWPDDLISRISNYFRDLGLARRFAVEAASELSGLENLLDELKAQDLRQAHLSTVAQVERRNRTNTWKAALYEALSKSAWYLGGGYRGHN